MDFDSKLWRESVVGDWERSYLPAGRRECALLNSRLPFPVPDCTDSSGRIGHIQATDTPFFKQRIPLHEEHTMHAHRFLSAVIVAAALLTPVAATAAATPAGAPETQRRVYDRSHKDYHVWDDREDQTYRTYLGDQHIKYRSYSTLGRKRQTTYWNYRHSQEK
jgi:hypothetical protein